METKPDVKQTTAPPQLVVISNERAEPASIAPLPGNARQRLEDEFRRRFFEQHPLSDVATAPRLESTNLQALHLDTEPAATINGRTS